MQKKSKKRNKFKIIYGGISRDLRRASSSVMAKIKLKQLEYNNKKSLLMGLSSLSLNKVSRSYFGKNLKMEYTNSKGKIKVRTLTRAEMTNVIMKKVPVSYIARILKLKK